VSGPFAILVTVLVGMIGVACFLLILVLTYVLLQVGNTYHRREKRLREDVAEEAAGGEDGEAEAAVADFVRFARGDADRETLDLWRREKREEGWTDEEIEDFLENRPLIELN
jgi:hypothetical protein